jgi:hypothetical protein
MLDLSGAADQMQRDAMIVKDLSNGIQWKRILRYQKRGENFLHRRTNLPSRMNDGEAGRGLSQRSFSQGKILSLMSHLICDGSHAPSGEAREDGRFFTQLKLDRDGKARISF